MGAAIGGVRSAGALALLSMPAPREDAWLAGGQIYERLAIVREDGRHAVLIVDEAHALARGGALEEVSALVKLEYDERRLLSVVLVGFCLPESPKWLVNQGQMERAAEAYAYIARVNKQT